MSATSDTSSKPTPHTPESTAPARLLGRIPELLGFVPRDSLVVAGTAGLRGAVRLTLRYDLPSPGDTQAITGMHAHAAGVLASQRLTHAVVIGYGPDALVAPMMESWRCDSEIAGVTVAGCLRVQDQRYWSYLCDSSTCCPPEGTPFTLNDAPEDAPVLASRDELAATLAGRTGEAAESMRLAATNAEARVARLIARARRRSTPAAVRRAVATAGVEAVTSAIGAYRDDGTITDEDELAWLMVVLREMRVRDDAWARMDPAHSKAHLRLWTDLTRAASPGYVAAPASLLAFVAWQCGNGALANVALDRARADQPGYSMAMMLRQAVSAGVPPSAARLPMTPQEVAASYDELDDQRDEDTGSKSKERNAGARTGSPETVQA
jgi:hypothetical protein